MPDNFVQQSSSSFVSAGMAGWGLQSRPSVLEELCAPLHCRCVGAAEVKGSQSLTREKLHVEGGFVVTVIIS